MSSLYVYTTEGTCIHPDGGSDDTSINRYFESVNLVVDSRDPAAPSLETYFRAILPSGRPEQLFLRFQGDDPDTLLEDCRSAVLDELVMEAGWEIQETDNSGDPSMLFQRAVLRPSTSPSEVFEDTPLAGRVDRLRAAVSDTTQQITVTGRNYETIADAVRVLADGSIVMAVADGDLSLSEAGLVFEQQTQQFDLTIPRESERALQQLSQQETTDKQATPPDEQRITSELSEIETQLQAIKEKDVSESTVREQLDSIVSGVYPSLSVSAGSIRSGLSAGRSDDGGEQTVNGPVQPPPGQRQPSGIRSRLTNGLVLGALAALVVAVSLVLAMMTGAIPPGSDDGGDDGGDDGEFKMTFLNPPSEVNASEAIELEIQVENVGNGTDNGTLTLEPAENLDSQNRTVDVELSPNETTNEMFTIPLNGVEADSYTISARLGEAKADTEVTVDSDSSGKNGQPEPPSATLSDLDISGEGSVATVTEREGDNVPIAVDVTNEGEQSSEFEPTLTVGGTEMTSRTIELDGGSNERVTFDVAPENLDIGSNNLEISVDDDDSTIGTLNVEQEDFNVSINKTTVEDGNLIVVLKLTDEKNPKVSPPRVNVDTPPDVADDEKEFGREAEKGDTTLLEFQIDGNTSEEISITVTPVGDDDTLAETNVNITG